MFVKTIDHKLLHENLTAFQLIDEDNSGEIDSEECVKKLKSMKDDPLFAAQIDEVDVEMFIKKVDLDNSGKISYSQFLAATLTDIHFSQENVKALFNDLDNYQ